MPASVSTMPVAPPASRKQSIFHFAGSGGSNSGSEPNSPVDEHPFIKLLSDIDEGDTDADSSSAALAAKAKNASFILSTVPRTSVPTPNLAYRSSSTPDISAMIRKKSGELVRPSLKSSLCLYNVQASTPQSPQLHKAVHFDTQLEHVRHFLAQQRPTAVSRGGSPVETETEDDTDAGTKAGMFGYVPPTRSLPARGVGRLVLRLPNFPHYPARDAPVAMQSLTLSADTRAVSGVVRTRNIAFEKNVAVRFTFDAWQTVSEVAATFQRSLTPEYDAFTFSIKIADLLSTIEKKTLFIAVRYTVGGEVYWDNNGGGNYRVEFVRENTPGADASINNAIKNALKNAVRNAVAQGGNERPPISPRRSAFALPMQPPQTVQSGDHAQTSSPSQAREEANNARQSRGGVNNAGPSQSHRADPSGSPSPPLRSGSGSASAPTSPTPTRNTLLSNRYDFSHSLRMFGAAPTPTPALRKSASRDDFDDALSMKETFESLPQLAYRAQPLRSGFQEQDHHTPKPKKVADVFDETPSSSMNSASSASSSASSISSLCTTDAARPAAGVSFNTAKLNPGSTREFGTSPPTAGGLSTGEFGPGRLSTYDFGPGRFNTRDFAPGGSGTGEPRSSELGAGAVNATQADNKSTLSASDFRSTPTRDFSLTPGRLSDLISKGQIDLSTLLDQYCFHTGSAPAQQSSPSGSSPATPAAAQFWGSAPTHSRSRSASSVTLAAPTTATPRDVSQFSE